MMRFSRTAAWRSSARHDTRRELEPRPRRHSVLRRPILMTLVLSACGDRPLDPGTAPVPARAVNLSGLPVEVDIWVDGNPVAPGLVDTQPSPSLWITPGQHTVGFSPAGASKPEASTEVTVPEESFVLIALVRGQVGPELRMITYPKAREGRITVRALNISAEPARLIVHAITGAPGGAQFTLDIEPGASAQTDLPGHHTVMVANRPQESPISISLRAGRVTDPLQEFNVVGPIALGRTVSGEVRTVIFHRSPVFMPDVYSF